MKKKSLVLAITIALASNIPLAAGPLKLKFKKRDIPMLKIKDPFDSLLDWAKKPNDSNTYFIAFSAVSNDKFGKATYMSGSLWLRKKTPWLLSRQPVERYYSDRYWRKPSTGGHFSYEQYPFDPDRTDKVQVMLDCRKKRIRITQGGTKTYIPLKFDRGVYYGHATASTGHDRSSYIFSFKKVKQTIVR